MFISYGMGGAIATILAGIVTEYSHPKWGFLVYSLMGLVVSFFAFRLTLESEKETMEEEEGNLIMNDLRLSRADTRNHTLAGENDGLRSSS